MAFIRKLPRKDLSEGWRLIRTVNLVANDKKTVQTELELSSLAYISEVWEMYREYEGRN